MLERTCERRLDGEPRQELHWRACADTRGIGDLVAHGRRRASHFGAIADSAQAAPIVFVTDRDPAALTVLDASLRGRGWRVEPLGAVADLFARPRAFAPACVVLDIAPPDGDGLALLRRLAEERAGLPVVVTAAVADVPMCVEAMKLGALDFFVKPLCESALVASVGHAIERSRTSLRDAAQMTMLRERQASLSPRERDVMTLVVSGLLNKQIGGELGISEITVKAHRGNVMRKMQADSLASLVTIATRLGLAPIASRSGHRRARLA